MGVPRLSENNDLPNRWVIKHGKIYYRVPPKDVQYWGKQWYLLGANMTEAVTEYESKLSALTSKHDIRLWDIHDLAAADNGLFPVTGAVIYFLFDDTHIVYIGQTTNHLSRILVHQRDKVFNRAYVLPVTEDKMSLYEIGYIDKYRPKYNKDHVLLGHMYR